MINSFSPGKRLFIRTFQLTVLFLSFTPLLRTVFNYIYNKLTSEQRRFLHSYCARLYRKVGWKVQGQWHITFLKKSIFVPIRREKTWLDWEIALSVVGHEVEIKETYKRILRSKHRPEIFVDVGANYGTHSLLFQSQGIYTLSVEPNAQCNAYHQHLAEANGFCANVASFALGAERGEIELFYPPMETWLGTTALGKAEKLMSNFELESQVVQLKTLDDLLVDVTVKNILVKIDVEGHEFEVLLGAENTLKEIRPFIIFECWKSGQRNKIINLLLASQYYIYGISSSSPYDLICLDQEGFLSFDGADFIASPVSNLSI